MFKYQKNTNYYLLYSYMFSKLIKIISVASVFLTLGAAFVATPSVSAATAAECVAQGFQGVNSAGVCGNNAPGAGGRGTPAGLPGAAILCANSGSAGGANSCPITSTAPTSATDIVKLIISIARFLSYISVGIAVIVIIYGGFLYLNPTDAKGAETGQKVLVQAAIGLAIALTAVTIVTILSQILTGSYF